MRKPIWAVTGVAAMLGATLVVPAAGISQAASPSPIDVLDMAYVEQVTTDLTQIGSAADGFRVFGTPQDKTTAEYVAAQMTDVGLQNVDVETMTGDGWLFKGASVRLRGQGQPTRFKAASLGGVPGTGQTPLRGEIVDVGYGTAPDYEGLNVRGKIVYARWDFDNYGIWPNMIAEEAKLHGATAAIISSGPGHYWYSAGHGRALGSNDGECGIKACAPLVTISKRDARGLKAAMAKGRVHGAVRLRAQNRLDATGYQSIGVIPGVGDPSRVIVFTAHHDAWFTSAADDSVGVAMMLALAKAVTDSGYQPYYTWVFAPVTGEEYGLANAYADWLQGAYHRVTVSHTEWQHDAVAVLNWEVHSPPYNVSAATSFEIRDVVKNSLQQSKDDGLIGGYGINDVFSWNDGFVYQATGTPSVTFAAFGGDYWGRYHTNYDTLDTLDFPALDPVLQAEASIALQMDQPTLPYAFDRRLASIGRSLDPTTIERFGGDVNAVETAYATLAAAAEAAAGAPYSACTMTEYRSAVNTIEDNLTALFLGEGTSYPHQQAEVDVVGLSDAIAALKGGHPRRALNALSTVSLNGQALYSSKRAYDRQLLVRSPGYKKLSWAVQGQYPLLLDLFDVTHQIRDRAVAGKKNFRQQITQLKPALHAQTVVYRERIVQDADLMNQAADDLQAAADC